jgi:hypothetical protein
VLTITKPSATKSGSDADVHHSHDHHDRAPGIRPPGGGQLEGDMRAAHDPSARMPSEKMLRCETTPGEYISYSEWEDEASIQRYLQSEHHQEIKRHNTNIKGAKVAVKHYCLVS